LEILPSREVDFKAAARQSAHNFAVQVLNGGDFLFRGFLFRLFVAGDEAEGDNQ
jgi:hypothetical protein